MKCLCEQFYRYNENGKILPISFLIRYARKLMILMNSGYYLYGVKSCTSFLDYSANYDYDTKIISVFFSQCIRCVEEDNDIRFNKNNYEHISLLNTYLIKAITHECFHGIQHRISNLKEKNNTLEANIFYDSLNIYAHKTYLYNLYYEIIPIEVNAEIMASIYGIEFINMLSEEEALYNNNRCIAEELLSHYFEDDKYYSPTKLFYHEIDEKKRYDNLVKNMSISNYKRMLLGLELDDYYINSLKDISDGKIEVARVKTYLMNK